MPLRRFCLRCHCSAAKLPLVAFIFIVVFNFINAIATAAELNGGIIRRGRRRGAEAKNAAALPIVGAIVAAAFAVPLPRYCQALLLHCPPPPPCRRHAITVTLLLRCHRHAATAAFVFIVVVATAAVLLRCHRRMLPPRYHHRPAAALPAVCRCRLTAMLPTTTVPPPR